MGAVFLILGTCIGGSMLALPMATAHEGLSRTLILMLSAWVMMTAGAFALLSVNLKLPENSNLISMAQATLGKTGAVITWITTLGLLYTLLAGYISGGQDLLAALFSYLHLPVPIWLDAVIFTLLLGYIVFRGIRLVDFVNRGLMSSKLLICILLIVLLIPFAKIGNLSFHHLSGSNSAMTCITAFGYASIIPSIRTYLKSHTKKLYWAILLGGLIPLVFYIAWIIAVQSTIPTTNSLSHLSASANPLKGMIEALALHVNNTGINVLANVFTSICILTSFLGVALSLTDFLSDGIKMDKSKITGGLLIALLTLLPPLVIVIISPAIFLQALNYAGILCILLLFCLPLVMVVAMKVKKAKQDILTSQTTSLS